MRANYLHDVWSALDDTRLTSTQFSFCFLAYVAAKIVEVAQALPVRQTELRGARGRFWCSFG